MKKRLCNILLLISFVLPFESFTQPVVVSANIPKEIGAGKRFNINLFIDKQDVESFARLQLNLPHGFTATEKISYNGDFIFGNNKVAIFWLDKRSKV